MSHFRSATIVAGVCAAAASLPFVLPKADASSVVSATTATSVAADTYSYDSVHSCAIFRVQHLGAGMFLGRFNTLEGSFTFTEVDGPTFDVSIPIKSIDTNNNNLNNHLKSPDFFNEVEHPAMTFKSTAAKLVRPKVWEVTGDLTLLGKTKPVTAEVTWTGTAEKRGATRTGLDAAFKFKRSEFGMDWGVEDGSLGDETHVLVNIEGVKQG